MEKNEDEFDRIVVTGVRSETKQTLTNIAKNKGKTVAALLRPVINDMIRNAPTDQKRPFLED
tara:strand:- start:510 stop:695 length:186 start_codon:yes stop_codon:yes gene_type:complete